MAEQYVGDTLPLTFPPYYDRSVSSLPNLAEIETPPSYESLWNQPRERCRILIFRMKSSMGSFKQKTRKILIGRTLFIVYGAFVINCIIFALCLGLIAPKVGDSNNWFNQDQEPIVDNENCISSIERIAGSLQWVCFVHAFSAFCSTLFSIAQFLRSCFGRPYSVMIFLAAVNCLFTGIYLILYFFAPWAQCGPDSEINLEQSYQLEMMLFLMLALGTNAVYILIAVLFSVLPEYGGERRDSGSARRRSRPSPQINISSIYDVGLNRTRRGRGPASAIEERVADAQRVNDMSIYIERCQINPPPPYQEPQ